MAPVTISPECALRVQPRLNATMSAGGSSLSIPEGLPSTIAPAQPAHDFFAIPVGPVVAEASHDLECGSPYMQINGQVLDILSSLISADLMDGYELACPLSSNLVYMEDATMDWQTDLQPPSNAVQNHKS